MVLQAIGFPHRRAAIRRRTVTGITRGRAATGRKGLASSAAVCGTLDGHFRDLPTSYGGRG